MTHFEALKKAEKCLLENKIDTSAFDAKQLLLFSFGLTNESYAMKKCEPCDNARLECFNEAVKRRAAREPLQYIIGEWDFCGREFYVENCLIPRPETEIAVQTALEFDIKNGLFVDMCCGSGCIGISYALERPYSRGIMLDISDSALKTAKRNTEKYSVKNVEIRKFDVFSDELEQMPDLLISNPPYINKADMANLEKELRYEPQNALYGGEDGLDFYRVICERFVSKMHGKIVFEIGIGQLLAVSKLLDNVGAKIIKVIKDSGGIDRTVLAEKR